MSVIIPTGSSSTPAVGVSRRDDRLGWIFHYGELTEPCIMESYNLEVETVPHCLLEITSFEVFGAKLEDLKEV